MCGIAGVLGNDDRPLVQQMCDRLAHRGPDGHDIFSDDGVVLGHRRLAILDPARGKQPMASADGRYTIVYNGECYNHRELRAALEREGADFQTATDTETVLQGYARWGPNVVERMEGMFAFAIWDSHDRRLFIARDPFGIKPFFYAYVDGALLFASEQKALFARMDAAPDIDRVKERAALEFLVGQGTLFRGVHQLPPGTWALVAPGEAVEWSLYHRVPVETFATAADAAAVLRDRFVASVREQLMADVPLGTILSGGLDSAAVAAAHVAAVVDAGGEAADVHTFTVADSEDVPDLVAARRVAEHLGTTHHESVFTVEDMLRDLPRYVWHNENINFTEYFFFPLFASMEAVKVALCGQGADELWGGYPRYRDPLPLARERIARIRQARPAHAEHLQATVAQTHSSGGALAEWDQQGQLANFQLRLVDRNSMAHGLEVRVPFLSRLQQHASRAVPWGWKLNDQVEKWILRKALEPLDLPRDIVWRPKLPAGRATSPRVVQQFEEHAARMVSPAQMDRGPMAGVFRTPAERLVHDLWVEVFARGGPVQDIAEAVA